jgi:uncharacterized protein (TIGR04551 family)
MMCFAFRPGRLLTGVVALAASWSVSGAHATPEDPEDKDKRAPKSLADGLTAPREGDAAALGDRGLPTTGAVRFTHHGLFRFRPELLLGGDLGQGTSGVPSPLGLDAGADEDASTLAWASVRLRYEPSILIGESVGVHLGLDVLDNLILGSTHEAAGGDVAFGLHGDGQAPASSGTFGWKDALTVREAYGQWLAFDMVDLRLGRMADHFGLGILRNDGACADCDFGSVVDRVAAAFTLSGFRIEGSWEFSAVGVTTETAFENERNAGQPKDLGQDDDVTTYTVKVGRMPVTAQEKAERSKLLDEERGWAFDWAVYTQLTDQPMSSLEQTTTTSVECAPSETLGNGQPVLDYDCVRLYPRDAFFWRPGLWFEARHRPAFGHEVRIAAEASALIGSIAHPQRLFEEDELEAKDFFGFGLAAELEWRRDTLVYGLELGLATGDDGPFVGVLDGNNVVDPEDDGFATNDDIRKNRTINAFYFHRDYHVDLILFRQVLGAVTNAFYVKPWVSADVLKTDDMTFSLRFDLLYALAVEPDGTPGEGRHWGVEADGRASLAFQSGFSASLALGGFLPLDALQNPLTGASADPAMALRALLGWSF